MNPLGVYTGIAYDFINHNCWHHVRNVRADAGLKTPEFDCTSPDFINETFTNAHDNSKGLEQHNEPSEYCAVLIASKRGKRLIWHSGVYLDGIVSHCDRFARQVRTDTLKSIIEKSERVEFWR
ncbi:hypothetical protein S349_42 [Shewanella sp. phage 3/49]|uniref:hypothetical protein n=1 Tax=Shewanella sp. phage 3/49 TaxID=1458863 RepID=UPI0004F76839|nr:hypothetical protein S349_42 [Shewanella sp. phage 3/49]AHK11832.1 hypothetical protein S349_42 [Shewanella sp. phage 3/49]